jgi:hypothetical protein
MTSPRSLLPLVAATAALALPAVASADAGVVSTVAFDGSGALVWTGGDQQNFMSAYVQEDGTLRLSDNGDGQIQPLDGHCQAADISYSLICEMPTAIRASMGGARDLWYGTDAAIPVTVDGGAGNDDFSATDRSDEFHGGAGDDRLLGGKGNDLLDGGDGKDIIEADEGADQLLGGAGDDTLTADGYNVDPSPDVIDGGAGYDTVESEWDDDVTDNPTPISITMGGGADDGRPGENDDLRGVEKIAVNIPGTYVGSESDDEITVRQILDPVVMRGGGGNDKLRTADGSDTVDGGAGADYLDGGFGDDTITGGAGADIIHGDIAGGDCGGGIYGYCKLPWGNDTINARDGEIDSVDCGAGTDTVKADADDVVGPDCETVDRAAAPVNDGPVGPGPVQPGAISAVAGKVRLAKALKSGLTVKVAVPAAGTLKATAKRSGKRVASGKATASAAGTTAVRLKFTTAARKALRSRSSARLAVSVTFAQQGGAVLKRTLKVTLRR